MVPTSTTWKRTILRLVLALGLVFAVSGTAMAAVWTDQADYAPGSTVTIHGDNSDGAGYLAGEIVNVDVTGPRGYTAHCSAVVDVDGSWSCDVTLWNSIAAFGRYSYVASGQLSGESETGSFTDGPQIGSHIADCSTPSTSFMSGATVCAKATGLGGDATGTIQWINPSSFVAQTTPFLASGNTTDTYVPLACGDWTLVLNIDDSTDPAPTSTFTVTNCSAQDLTVTKTLTASYTRTYAWTIDKSAAETTINTSGPATAHYQIDVTRDDGTDSGWRLDGTLTVHNPNNFAVLGVNVTDFSLGGICSVTGGIGLIVPALGDQTVSFSCTFASNPGSGSFTGTASWPSYGSPNTSANVVASYAFGDPTDLVLDSIEVTDTNGGSWNFTDDDSVNYDQDYNLDPAGTCTEHDNTATITETGQNDSWTVTVCVGADLVVTKDANPSFTRTYLWSIGKSVDKTLVEAFGGNATFNYTVNVAQTGFSDSAWQVAGTIHVENPNDWQSITFDATDAVPGGSCTVTGGTAVVLAPLGSTDLPYTCTFALQPVYDTDITNTATATWDGVAAFTPNSSADGTADFQFNGPTTKVNDTVTVTDTFNASPTTLDTLTATDDEPFTSESYNYSHTVPVPASNCVSYANTAALTETGQSASQTVKVCGPAKTGALTMGYWQNKNGQDIIKGGASTSGTCNSGTWLRTFAPFQDLSATASCTQVATYVTNIIKAANASGAAMNAMLKGQMLATALDVYFSNAALGGNKINAPAPIGGVSIDLTNICKPGNTSSCVNSSSVFGGSPKTVLQMLTYAASQSNAGGGTWYGQVKVTQELAKNAFDSVNNQVAFAP